MAEPVSRPWPVVLLTALGAWLAAAPLLGVVGLLLGDVISRGIGPYFAGALLLAGGVVVLRAERAAIFVEQLAVPALLVGAGTLAFGLFRDLPERAAAVALVALSFGLAAAIDRPWLRVLLGGSMAGFSIAALVPTGSWLRAGAPAWLALHAALLAGLVVFHGVQKTKGVVAAIAEPLATGWSAVVLAGLAWWSGMTFLVGGALGNGIAADIVRMTRSHGATALALQAASGLLALGGAVLLARAWPSLRSWQFASASAVAVGLAAFMPALGGVLLALCVFAAPGRWRLAAAAALAGAWIIGAFYYQLQWTLSFKALVLVGAGVFLGALALSRPAAPARRDDATGPAPARAAALIGLAGVAALVIANYAIWQKETLIATGERVLVPLAPLDPRSLMQGDFMRLAYALPGDVDATVGGKLQSRRPSVVAVRDERGVARLLRVAREGEPLAPGEMRIELTPRDGRWVLVSDAWFFREGDAARWEPARYAEFRVQPDGRALLVGLADAQLRIIPIRP